MRFCLQISICQSSTDAQRLLNELADRSWKLGNIDSLLKRIHKTGTIVW